MRFSEIAHTALSITELYSSLDWHVYCDLRAMNSTHIFNYYRKYKLADLPDLPASSSLLTSSTVIPIQLACTDTGAPYLV
jgi:hypothetical protein